MSSILIVDDSRSARETLVAILEGEDYQLLTAQNGAEALQAAVHYQPDAILLDVMMPGMDGFEVCRRIRSTPEVAEVPIVILTALDDREALLKGLEVGADDFFTKPIDRRELLVRVRTITRLNRYRKLAEQRLRLGELAERVVTAQEQERLRISRELHDDLGQALTTHLMDIRNLQKEIPGTTQGIQARLEMLHKQTHEIFTKVRQLAHDLRPPILDTLNFNQALRSYCEEFSSRTHLPIAFEIDPDLPDLSDVHSAILYRILQESLTNVAKHAQANRIWVELSMDEQTVILTIQDNGRGLSAEGKQSNGIGITGMRERLALVSGQLSLRSSPRGGTILSATIPLKAPALTSKEDV